MTRRMPRPCPFSPPRSRDHNRCPSLLCRPWRRSALDLELARLRACLQALDLPLVSPRCSVGKRFLLDGRRSTIGEPPFLPRAACRPRALNGVIFAFILTAQGLLFTSRTARPAAGSAKAFVHAQGLRTSRAGIIIELYNLHHRLVAGLPPGRCIPRQS